MIQHETDNLACAQAAPPTLQRCRIYVAAREEVSSNCSAEQDALRVKRFPDTPGIVTELEEHVDTQRFNSAAELLEAVREFAAARGVIVGLEDGGRCVVISGADDVAGRSSAALLH